MSTTRAYLYAIISMILWGFTFPLSIKVTPEPLLKNYPNLDNWRSVTEDQ